MALIKRREKEDKVNITFRLGENLVAQLREYSEWANVSPAEIIESSVRFAIKSDADFLHELSKRNPGTIAQPKQAKVQAKAQAAT